MSLSEKSAARARSRLHLAGVVVCLVMTAAISACTVRPFYAEPQASETSAPGLTEQLSAISIGPARSRHEQEVRNHLIFLFGGGAGEPAHPRYALDINVRARIEEAAIRQVAREDEPTAGSVTLIARYRLTATGSGELVGSGIRSFTASFDRPRQQFATLRAERDAHNRAARELAEVLRLAVAQHLESRRRQE